MSVFNWEPHFVSGAVPRIVIFILEWDCHVVLQPPLWIRASILEQKIDTLWKDYSWEAITEQSRAINSERLFPTGKMDFLPVGPLTLTLYRSPEGPLLVHIGSFKEWFFSKQGVRPMPLTRRVGKGGRKGFLAWACWSNPGLAGGARSDFAGCVQHCCFSKMCHAWMCCVCKVCVVKELLCYAWVPWFPSAFFLKGLIKEKELHIQMDSGGTYLSSWGHRKAVALVPWSKAARLWGPTAAEGWLTLGLCRECARIRNSDKLLLRPTGLRST